MTDFKRESSNVVSYRITASLVHTISNTDSNTKKNLQNSCHQMSSFKTKMHQI